MKNPIYPEVSIKSELMETILGKQLVLTIETCLRKEYEGKWYLWHFRDVCTLPSNNEDEKIKALNRFHSQVYTAIICGKVSTNLTDMRGEPVFKEDEIQISEVERIKELIGYNKL